MHLPGPFRAVIGLVATAVEEARHLPDRMIEIPMLAVSTALQASLRAQQRYARLAARGDDVLNRRPPTDEPPSWATFDDPVPIDQLRGNGSPLSGASLLDDLFGVHDPRRNGGPPTADTTEDSDRDDTTPDDTKPDDAAETSRRTTGKTAPPRQPAAKKPPPRQPAAKTAKKTAKKTAGAKKAPGKSDTGSEADTSSGAKPDAAVPDPESASGGRTVSKPRHTAPSRFDDASG